MSERLCDCGACPICFAHGDPAPPRFVPAPSADDVIRATDPHAAPAAAKGRRGKPAAPVPGLFDDAEGEVPRG